MKKKTETGRGRGKKLRRDVQCTTAAARERERENLIRAAMTLRLTGGKGQTQNYFRVGDTSTLRRTRMRTRAETSGRITNARMDVKIKSNF